jgi:hypothetical protein
LRAFLLQQPKDWITEEEFDDYTFLIFGRPERFTYRNDIVRFRVPIFNPFQHNDLLGYLPLPFKYYTHWVNLCYTIVYQRNAYLTLQTAIQPANKNTKGVLTSNFHSVAALLKYLLYARGMIIEEMLSMKGQMVITLPIFDEFIIKDRFDYCWEFEDDLRTQPHIFKDPFSDEMKEHMRMLTPLSIFANLTPSEIGLRKREIIEDMQPPKNDWDWIDGKLRHINMSQKLQNELPYLVDTYTDDSHGIELYFHAKNEDTLTGWEDFAFRWLNEHEDKVFHNPGPSLVRRREFVNFFISLLPCLK